MRYFERQNTVSHALQREAKAWLVRLTSGEATTEDAAAFRLWHGKSPRHVAAFAESKRLWQALGPAIDAELRQPSPDAGSLFMPDRRSSPNAGGAFMPGRRSSPVAGGTFLPGRRAFIGAALAGAGYLAVGQAFNWPLLPGMAGDYTTATGEQKQFSLGADVTVAMNTQTQINLRRQAADSAGIELLTGEAQIAIAAANPNPFTVYAQRGEARAVTGRFNIRHVDNTVCVTCLQGEVRVAYRGRQNTLSAGQQLTYNDRELGPVTGANEEQVDAWRRQLLIFDRQPLSKVVEEVNRYRSGKIILVNQDLGRRQVQARFTLDQLAEVIALIRDAYGARVTSLPGGIVLLS